METTKVVVATFDGVTLVPRYVNLSCPFPVSSVEISLVPELQLGNIQDQVVAFTSSLVDGECVGVVPCKTAPFQSHFQRFTFSQPKNIQGLYSVTVNDPLFIGRLYMIVIMKQ